MTKYKFVTRLAQSLAVNSTTITGYHLATLLNRAGFTTNYGTPYNGARGTFTLVHASYDRRAAVGKQNEADAIADAFTNQNGEYAYN